MNDCNIFRQKKKIHEYGRDDTTSYVTAFVLSWHIFGRWFTSVGMLMCLILLSACAGAPQSGGTEQPSDFNSFLHPPTKAPTATLVPPGEIDLTGKLDDNGVVIDPLTITAPDGCMRLELEPGTVVQTADGAPLERLTIAQDYAGKLPVEAYGVSISYAYRFGLEQVRFSKPAKIVFTCLKNMKRSLIFEISLGIKGDGGEWDQISVQGDDTSVWTRLDSLVPGQRYLLVGPAPMGS